MKRKFAKLSAILLSLVFVLSIPYKVFSVEGSLGYEGGISTENKMEEDEYNYSEICFLTGKPVLLSGTLTIKKTDRNNVINSTYTYRLSNSDYNATMNRVVIYSTVRETKANGQTTETTKLSRLPAETITIDGTTYRLMESSFTRSLITDPKPAIKYHAGEFSQEKLYSIGANFNQTDTVKVTLSGRLYAYDQHWSSTQTQKINVAIEANINSGNKPVKWGGIAEIVLSSAKLSRISYTENEPTLISFDGGYVQSNWDEAAIDYTARLPEFDQNGNPTDIIRTYSNIHSLVSSKEYTRLMVPDIKHLNGFWAEEPISILFGLEIIPGTGSDFKTGKYITRRDFVTMLMKVLKDVPEDPNVRQSYGNVRRRPNEKNVEVSPFYDVNVDDSCYNEIKMAFEKGIVLGDGKGRFYPDALITRTEAVKMVVSALGLENIAPYPLSSTPFTDDNLIPVYARNSIAAASRLGLVTADERGRFNPLSPVTNENAAVMLYELINYMGDELIRDYRDRIMDF
jgi:N-acetylmuramoyl-L-alanine amidase